MPEQVQPRAKRRLRATVHYDGSGFHGWQVQLTDRTVQGEIEAALQRLFSETVRVLAAGRTDAGVHAAGQEIAFDLPEDWSRRDESEIRDALNAHLPPDAWVEKLAGTAREFHPRFDATGRRYAYFLGVRADAVSPIRRGRIWGLGRVPDPDLLQEATEALPGEHSFAALSKSGQPERGTRCRVEMARWDRTPLGDLRFTIVADRFLHHMVRYLVATLVEVAEGRRPADALARLLEEADDVRPPRPAPAEGLYLTGVRYEGGWNREAGVPGLSAEEDITESSG